MERASGWGLRQRRELLAGALRLSRSMAPEVARALAECREVLGYAGPIEVFVRPEPRLQAFCSRNPSGPLLIGFSSALLEKMTPGELRFVIGHELGHAKLDHFGIPMPQTATVEDIGGILVSRRTQLELFVWCRAAEVSADRLGLLCARDPEVAARAFFKLASGVASDVIQPDLTAFIKQVESIASAPAAVADPREEDDTLDCFCTHPYTPVRVRALLAFARSDAFREATGASGGAHGLTTDELEAVVERDLAMMNPSYLEEKGPTSELMRRLLYCAGVSVAAAHDGISEREMGALRALLGATEAPAPVAVDDVRRELGTRLIEAADKVPLAGRAQLVQHLTVIAAADGDVDAAELAEIERIAGCLAVDPRIIGETLAASAAPMD
jgi:uncharacterized tellurite resistance protein B-like protein